jgi:hypothetical protein
MAYARARIVVGVAAAALAALAAPAYSQTTFDCRNYSYMPRNNDRPDHDNGQALGAFRLLIQQAASADANGRTLLQSAKDGCEGLLKAGGSRGKRNINAQECYGDATALLASDFASRQTAYCAYQAVHQLAGRDNSAASRRADIAALKGQAKLWAAMGNPRRASDTYADALRLVEPAPDHELLLALADSQALAGLPEALNTYERLFALPDNPDAFDNAKKSQTRTKQARLVAATPPVDTNRLRELWAAAALYGPSPEAHYRIGKIDFDAKDPKARASFEAATRIASFPPEQAGFRADSFYHLALLDARQAAAMDPKAARDAGIWQTVQDNAGQAGVGAAGGLRLQCLAFVAEGNKTELEFARSSRPEAMMCTGGDASPEAKLLEGLYYMRRAQFVPVGCIPGLSSARQPNCRGSIEQATGDRAYFLALAESAFAFGAQQAANQPRPFDWLLEGKTQPLVGAYLAAGKDMALSALAVVNDVCQLEVRPPPADVAPLFRTLDLLQCKPPYRR